MTDGNTILLLLRPAFEKYSKTQSVKLTIESIGMKSVGLSPGAEKI